MPHYKISTLTLEETAEYQPAFEILEETVEPLQVHAAPVRTPSAPIAGVYSNSGFDMIQILSSIANRPNPQINLGPIDLSCSFLVSDARQYDCPIIYCSPAFETLTGYSSSEILGKNCRFLQAPDGLVTGGSRRLYTDNQAVYHLKAQLVQNREHQASIINYRKGGQAFVNLITVIPLLDSQGEVAYYVGLQVDLVEQPNSIMEKMKDGTYLINYQQNPLPLQLPSRSVLDQMDDYFRELPSLGGHNFLANPEVMALIKSKARCDSENEQSQLVEWNKLVLDQSVDFIHVISLKGFFLYCSSATTSLLEYEPSDLLGKSLSSICHPSDIVPVMREIKEAAASGNSGKVIDLLFRVRRKNSGYMWMECRGRLHMDQSKSRKCLVLSGRQRPVYKLQWRDICSSSADETEFWAKTSLTGLYLHVAQKCQEIIGFSAESLEGASIYQYIPNHEIPDMSRAFDLVSQGQRVNLQHSILNEKGNYSTVTSTFYPGDESSQSGPTFALVQTRIGREVAFRTTNNLQENVFCEIESIRGTSWQYELHQLQLSNKRLQEQIDALSGPKRKKQRKRKNMMEVSKMCAQCQSQDSPEWRRGPNGPKELCNACGLRYAKTLQTKYKATGA
ncbi:white collar one A [Phycomyces nitens]|nr:white collar one A [Phycomyces nitens]